MPASPTAPAPSLRTAIDRFFEASLFLLIVTGFATLAATGRLDPLSILGGWTALGIRGYLLLRNRQVALAERWTSLLTLFYILFYGADYLFLSGSFVPATVHLVLFIMIVKMFSVRHERDYVYLAVLSFLEVLSAAVLTVDTAFFAAFCFFTVVGVATFVSMEMRRSAKWSDALPEPQVSGAPRRLARALSLTAISLTLTIVVAAAAIFFLLPRLSAGYLSSYAPHNEFVTGFSDQVQLGTIGRIQQSDTVVMHVHIDNDHGSFASLLWRGVALADFDGRTWRSGNVTESLATHATGRFDLFAAEKKAGNIGGEFADAWRDSERLRYSVEMEPVGTRALFLASVPVSVFGRMRELGVDDSGSVWTMDTSRMLEGYTAVSLLPNRSEQRKLADSAAPAAVSDVYLGLPPTLDARIPALAHQIADAHAEPFDKAAAIEQYLRTHYGYTLQLAATPPRDPLAWFLFQRKQGHCEYFASAMAVMLRTIGIPSRVVNGFRNGEYNDVTGSYIVRGRDAHSWVEAYFPGVGWTVFDPTPGAAASDFGLMHRLGLYGDAAREFWREWVINYDFLHQQNIALTAIARGRGMGDRLRLWLRHEYRTLVHGARRAYSRGTNASPREITVLIIAAGLLLAVLRSRPLLRSLGEHRLARNPRRAPDQAASIWYLRLLRKLSHRGWHKLPTQTPGEFAASIEDPALRSAVEKFTVRYESARFGKSINDAEELPELFQEIAGK